MKSLGRLKLPDEALSPILKENLRHEDEQVRLAVVNLLVERRALLARMAPELESLLTAKNDGVSRHAAFLLGKIGPNAAPLLLNGLRSREQPDRSDCRGIGTDRPADRSVALAGGRKPRSLAFAEVRPWHWDRFVPWPQEPCRRWRPAWMTLTRTSSSLSLRPLVTSVREPPNVHRPFVACWEINRPRSAFRRFRSFLSQHAHDERLLGDLIALVNDEDARVQRQSIDTIRSLGPPGRKAITVIIGKLNSKDPEVRLAAAEMIGSHGQAAAEAVPALSSLLDDPSPKLRTIAAQTLGKLGKAAQPALPRLTPLLGAEQVEVREAATLTLGSLELDAEVVRPHLAKALRDKAPEVRRAAMRAIQRFGPQGAIFVPDIILLAESKENLRSVERMLRRFERQGPDVRSLPELVKQLDHKQDSVRLLAIKFLGLAGPSAKDAIPALERMSKDPSAEVRKQAEAASKQIKNNPASKSNQQASRSLTNGATA